MGAEVKGAEARWERRERVPLEIGRCGDCGSGVVIRARPLLAPLLVVHGAKRARNAIVHAHAARLRERLAARLHGFGERVLSDAARAAAAQMPLHCHLMPCSRVLAAVVLLATALVCDCRALRLNC